MSFATTAYDRPVPALAVPGAVARGTAPSLQLVDGFTRGDKIVGRFETSPGLLAIKVAEPTAPVRVTVTLTADNDTAAWWERRVPEHVQPRLPHGTRLLAIRSQGRTRGAVLLARRPQDFVLRAQARTTFDLRPDELPGDGFLIVEAVDADAGAPSWAAPRAPHAAVGVRIDSIEVAPVPAEAPRAIRPGSTLDGVTCEQLELVGTGDAGRTASVDVRAGFFLARRAPDVPGPVSWTLRPWLTGEMRPDSVPDVPGPVIPKPGPGEPPLSVREKAMAVARHELTSVRDDVTRKARHVAARGLRKAVKPVDDGLAHRVCGDLLDRGLIQAAVMPLDSAEPRPCRVTAASGGRIAVTCTEPPDGPAVVYVGAVTGTGGPVTRTTGGRLHWRLVSATYGQQP